MACLKLLTGGHAGRIFELTAKEVAIGRNPASDLLLSESTVSRRHARIRREGDGFWLDDLGSAHGTFVNGQRLSTPRRLQHEDHIQITPNELVFLTSTQEDSLFDEDEGRDHSSTILSIKDVLGDSSADGENPRAKLHALLEIMHDVGVSLDLRQVFPRMLECVFRIFQQADRAYLLLANERVMHGGEPRLDVMAMKLRQESAQMNSPISRTIARRVMAEAKAVLSSDASQDPRFQAAESIHGLHLRSVMCAPLIGTARKPLGMIQVDTQNPVRQFTLDDLDVLVIIANLAAQAVDHARLHETQLQFHRRERDLEIAQQVQKHFLPETNPEIPHYQVRHFYQAADGVGGDYFGYTPLPDGRLAFTMADVAGKGMPAALLMARLCAEVRYALLTHSDPAAAVEFLNRQFAQQVGYNCFITFLLGLLDIQRHELTLVNAGHMPPLRRHGDTGVIEALAPDAAGPPLGIDASLHYRAIVTEIKPGDVVLLYTDGVNEAASPLGKLYGIERIQAVLEGSANATETLQRLLQEVRSFSGEKPQDDDICIVCFSREPD